MPNYRVKFIEVAAGHKTWEGVYAASTEDFARSQLIRAAFPGCLFLPNREYSRDTGREFGQIAKRLGKEELWSTSTGLGYFEVTAELNPAAVALGKLGGKIGGKAKSDAKTAAARENGKKGGWPKGKPRKKP